MHKFRVFSDILTFKTGSKIAAKTNKNKNYVTIWKKFHYFLDHFKCILSSNLSIKKRMNLKQIGMHKMPKSLC